jgi:Ca2+-binding RTX toxin-like protein
MKGRHSEIEIRAMRRAILLLTVMITALALASGVAIAQVVTCPTGANGICVGTDNNDTLNGTAAGDDMRGLKGQDTLNAAADFDLLNGGRGNDTLNGEADNDTLSGDLGDDTLKGGAQDDAYLFADGWGQDRIVDDAATGMFGERLSFSLVNEPITMDLISSPARPEVQSGSNTLNFGPNVSVNEVDGSSKGDTIKGDTSNDFLNGIQGNDGVIGRGGNDTVVGMDGKDTLVGGPGEDDFDAGGGADRIEAAEKVAEPDSISCGGGNDIVFFDQGIDTLLNANACENKRPQ